MVPSTLKHLFSSRLRVKLLEHLFFHPGEGLHVRRLESLLGESAGNLARELARLERSGIVSSRRIGNQKHFTTNSACPIFEDLRSIFLKTSGASSELRETLTRLPGVELAFIYGSYANGEAGALSDLDVMIIGRVAERQLAPLVARVERKLKREINYTLYTREEVTTRIGKKGDFVSEAFSGPRILLAGSADDRLLRAAG
jgi:predicted nucleotidyltransferase